MPFEVNLGKPPAGYVKNAAKPGESVFIQYLEFTSSEDGQHFIQRLEGLPNEIVSKLSPEIRASQIDHMLAVVRRDGSATVYVNELLPRARVRARGPVKAGQIVTKNDIADIERLELGVNIPDDAGVLFVFSVGWRKGLFYDFGPIGRQNPEPRQYDLADVFGQAYCHVAFQERFSISDIEWDALLAAKWFPFAGLKNESIDELISHVRSEWNPDEKLTQFVAEVREKANQMLDSWRNHSSFMSHVEILEKAIERFQNDDFVSCTGLLYPRIEGILRTHHTSLGTSAKSSPDNLTNSAVASKINNTKCLLLPHRFAAYLSEVYFADFNPVAHNIDVSRHSVGHGVATASNFNQKSALLAILVVHQLFYFLDNQQPTKPTK